MISISTIVPNDTGENVLVFKERRRSKIKTNVARVSRVKTLDGKVSVSHRGYTDSDRTLKIKARLNKNDEVILRALFTQESFVNVSIDDGFYEGVIESVSGEGGDITMNILIVSKLN